MTTEIADEILQLEAQRCDALVAADLKSLASLVADDLVHIHANGTVEDKVSYLNILTTHEFIEVRRPALRVRHYGDVAVVTGLLHQKLRVKASGALLDMRAATTQMWVRDPGGWRQSSFQATNVA